MNVSCWCWNRRLVSPELPCWSSRDILIVSTHVNRVCIIVSCRSDVTQHRYIFIKNCRAIYPYKDNQRSPDDFDGTRLLPPYPQPQPQPPHTHTHTHILVFDMYTIRNLKFGSNSTYFMYGNDNINTLSDIQYLCRRPWHCCSILNELLQWHTYIYDLH